MSFVKTIVITGGPCAGKTTAMSWIQNAFTKRGYSVLFVPETATELITGGVAPWTVRENVDFQTLLLRLQLDKEQTFQRAAKLLKNDRALIVCDRGALDNCAYMSKADFRRVADALHKNEAELRDRYDAVFHLVTAAKGAGDHYTLDNNAARTETPEQACAIDDKIIAAWTGHAHLRIIDNATDFDVKMQRVLSEITAFLGDPAPGEIRRRFLIDMPDLPKLRALPNCRRIEIAQTYLPDARRIIRRGADGAYTHYLTKRNAQGVETERRLTEGEYGRLMDAARGSKTLRKDRYCLSHQTQYFEIDVYPFWRDQAVLEIEVQNMDEAITFPDFVKVIKEATGDEAYSSRGLANVVPS